MASVSFLDRFPFCVLPAQEWNGTTVYTDGSTAAPSASSGSYSPVFGQGTHYPVGFTLDEVMELYWRIAAWEFVFTSDIFDVETTLTLPFSWFQAYDSSYSYSGDQVPSYDFINEREEHILICDSSYGVEGEFDYAANFDNMDFGFEFYGESGTYTQEATNTLILAEGIPDLAPISRIEHVVSAETGVTFEFRINMFSYVLPFLDGSLFSPPILFDEGSRLYYPQFSFAISLEAGTSFWSSTKPDTSESPVDTVDFFGKPVNVYGPSFSNITLSITPKYWWPYDGGSGPTYDVNTGSPL